MASRSEYGQTELAIAEAQRDLDDAEYHLGFLLNPVRHFIVRPALHIGSKVLPPVAKLVPPLDPIISFGLSIPFAAARHVYYVTHSEQFDATWKTYRDARRQIESFTDRVGTGALIASADLAKRYEISEVRNLVGALVHFSIEFWSRPKYNLRMWREYEEKLVAYCKSAGIDEGKLLERLACDRFAVNVRILGSVQKKYDDTETRRMRTALVKAGQPEDYLQMCNDIEVADASTVAKMMRYAISAYGTPAMDAYDILAKKYKPDLDVVKKAPWDGGEALKQQVCDHVGIPPSYITHFYLGAGGDLNVLRYYISVDQELKAVVLVVRGTYSITQWHMNFQGQSTPFAGGEAHSGIAELATSIVAKCRDELLEGLTMNPSYKLMITGQSLGGGVCPLVNILLHQDGEIGKRRIECHAFAGPPVYCSDNVPPVVAKAISNCTHYLLGDDTVPYLGLHQVRRTNAQLVAIEALTRKEGFTSSKLIAMGHKEPSQEMIDAALHGDENVKPIPGGPKLMMPARQHVWFVLDREAGGGEGPGEVNYTVCTPEAFASLSIFLCGDTGLVDHVPQTYEFVLNTAAERGWQMKTYTE